MNKKIATSIQHRAQFILSLCLLLGALGVWASSYTKAAQSTLTVRDAVEEEDERTLRAKTGFKFELDANKKIIVREIKTNKYAALGDNLCGGGCDKCSTTLDWDSKVKCLGCGGNTACKRKEPL